MIWNTSTSQMHNHINHLTLSERKNENFQKTEKKCINAYFLTQVFLLVLGTWTQWCDLIIQTLSPAMNQAIFF